MARILCVEDSKEFQIYLSAILREHTLTHVATISQALRAVEGGRASYDLILLDISLPDGNGMKILPRLKEASSDLIVPVIVISSDVDVLTKVAAFGMGADDFVTKPPDSSELKARIEAKLRWRNSLPDRQSKVGFGDVVVDAERMLVEFIHKDGTRAPIDLTPFEFKMFRLLIGRPGQVFSREHIIQRIWGSEKYVTPRTVDAHVSHLRTKLRDTQVQIETVLSAGYKAFLKDKISNSDNS